MGSKYELTIDTNYVSDWNIAQAVRELFQNSVDSEVQNPGNTSYWKYDEDTQKLYIGNKYSVLNVETLLLGVSTKTNDNPTIGQFGEGYKIATVVLLRTNHPITFYNYGAKEVWTTKLVKSRRFNGRLVPTFYVDKKYPWQKVPDNNLTIVVENITSEDYKLICDYILSLHTDIGDTIDCGRFGTILLDPELRGKVFVSGLYVCTNERLNYGYNIKPVFLQLDRDRKTVDNFNLLWTTSRMWVENQEKTEFIEMLYGEDTPPDISYIGSLCNADSIDPTVLDKFLNTYGPDAIPVTSQEDYDLVLSMGGHPVFVNKVLGDVTKSISNNFLSTAVQTKSCLDMLTEWYKELEQEVDIPYELDDKFHRILELYEDRLS